ncbi:MAG: hypothetical protein NVS2B16_01060 [Chloroflexota bacterium]
MRGMRMTDAGHGDPRHEVENRIAVKVEESAIAPVRKANLGPLGHALEARSNELTLALIDF